MSDPEQPPSHAGLYALIGLMTLFWALNFVIAKVALREIPPLLMGGMRALMAGMFISPIYAARRPHRWTRADVPALLGLGFVGVALNQLFFVIGLERTSVAHAAVLIALSPMFVLLIAAIVGQERITAAKCVGMGLALLGVAVLQFSRSGAGGASILGDVFILLAALTFSIFTVFGKQMATVQGSVVVNTFGYLGGGMLLLPMTLWAASSFDFGAVSARAWASMLYMSLFPSVVSYLIFYHVLRYIPASRAVAFSYLQPLIATGLAVTLLGEGLNSSLVSGGALVLAGVWVTERAR